MFLLSKFRMALIAWPVYCYCNINVYADRGVMSHADTLPRPRVVINRIVFFSGNFDKLDLLILQDSVLLTYIVPTIPSQLVYSHFVNSQLVYSHFVY